MESKRLDGFANSPPESRILFVSQESSAEIVQEAFSLGATGYVTKTDAGTELLAAVEAVCEGRRFVGEAAGQELTEGRPSGHLTAPSEQSEEAPLSWN